MSESGNMNDDEYSRYLTPIVDDDCKTSPAKSDFNRNFSPMPTEGGFCWDSVRDLKPVKSPSIIMKKSVHARDKVAAVMSTWKESEKLPPDIKLKPDLRPLSPSDKDLVRCVTAMNRNDTTSSSFISKVYPNEQFSFNESALCTPQMKKLGISMNPVALTAKDESKQFLTTAASTKQRLRKFKLGLPPEMRAAVVKEFITLQETASAAVSASVVKHATEQVPVNDNSRPDTGKTSELPMLPRKSIENKVPPVLNNKMLIMDDSTIANKSGLGSNNSTKVISPGSVHILKQYMTESATDVLQPSAVFSYISTAKSERRSSTGTHSETLHVIEIKPKGNISHVRLSTARSNFSANSLDNAQSHTKRALVPIELSEGGGRNSHVSHSKSETKLVLEVRPPSPGAEGSIEILDSCSRTVDASVGDFDEEDSNVITNNAAILSAMAVTSSTYKKIGNSLLGAELKCSICARKGTLWCPGCSLAYCANCWSSVPHHGFLDKPELWSPDPANAIAMSPMKQQEKGRAISFIESNAPVDIFLGSSGAIISGSLPLPEKHKVLSSRQGRALGSNYIASENSICNSANSKREKMVEGLEPAVKRVSNNNNNLASELPSVKRESWHEKMSKLQEQRGRGGGDAFSPKRPPNVSSPPPAPMQPVTKGSTLDAMSTVSNRSLAPSLGSMRTTSRGSAAKITDLLPDEWRSSSPTNRNPTGLFKGIMVHTSPRFTAAPKVVVTAKSTHIGASR